MSRGPDPRLLLRCPSHMVLAALDHIQISGVWFLRPWRGSACAGTRVEIAGRWTVRPLHRGSENGRSQNCKGTVFLLSGIPVAHPNGELDG